MDEAVRYGFGGFRVVSEIQDAHRMYPRDYKLVTVELLNQLINKIGILDSKTPRSTLDNYENQIDAAIKVRVIKHLLSNTIYQIPLIKYHLSNTFYQIIIKYCLSNTKSKFF